MNISWVIGSHGLLGRAVCDELSARRVTVYRPDFRFAWSQPDTLRQQFEHAVLQFGQRVLAAGSWSIYWCAGVGSMQSARAALIAETQAIECLLLQLGANAALLSRAGGLALASSAGAVYAGSTDAIISELSAPAPTTDYARAKLQQEALLAAFCATHPSVSVLAARCSTLYGPGQALTKAQGLLTHIARRVVLNQPIQIYVPLDTIRDYIDVSDAARGMVGALQSVEFGTVTAKIVASERATTISEIIAVFRRVSRRAPKIVTAAAQARSLYSPKIQFRSATAPDLLPLYRVSLVVGIARLLDAERSRYALAAA